MTEPLNSLKRFGVALVIGMSICRLQAASASSDGEPAYNGRYLSDWLLLRAGGDDSAEFAIRQMGTNSIPTLIQILGATERSKGRVVRSLKGPEFRKNFPWPGRHRRDPARLRRGCVCHFGDQC
jgi:hypothetical protein